MLEVIPVRGIGEVAPGADLAALIAEAAPWLRDGDVLVVTSKVVSKAEGRLAQVPRSGPERDQARAEVAAAETARTVAVRGETRVVATHHGFVMASAGVDASNVDPSQLVLLPKDPDASARALRAAFAERYGRSVAVIISDTMGRPWRNGLVDAALGAAGIAPLRDYRGGVDPYGNELRLTQMAVVDELAAAAELVKGKTDRIPVAVIRGFPTDPADGSGVVATLVRDAGSDLFSLGTAEARAAGLRDAATLPDTPDLPTDPVDPAAVRRAIATVDGRSRMELDPDLATIVCTATDPSPASLIRLGADVHRLRAALAAEGIPSAMRIGADAVQVLISR
jgi:coenzyme F420-0:L-glutamate ligase/coenzyme F420-1:gamma-L-glutamate ligase